MTEELYIEIPEEDYQAIGLHRASPDKVNEVLQLLIDPPDGEKQKQLHGVLDFKTHRCYDDDGKIYLSRHGIAEEMNWGTPNNASRKLKPLKANPLNENKNLTIDINMYLLETERGINKTKCWRVSNEKLARSLTTATEEYYFELSDEEKDEILELLEEMNWQRPTLLAEKDDSVYYTLLSNFYHKLKNFKRSRSDSDKNSKLVDKYIGRYEEHI